MERLLDGIRQFQRDVFPQRKDLFRQLAEGQHPHSLFITCADSRVVPDMITQSQPGDLFICRNVGNMVPSYGEFHGGVASTIEYAVTVLNVEDVIICGHTDCGAMKGLLKPEMLNDMPSVKNWLAHGDLARAMVKENYKDLSPEEELNALIAENAVSQLAHLHTFPCVATRVARGKLRLHAWVYDIQTGEVRTYDAEKHKYVPIHEYRPAAVASRLNTAVVA
jgi:carbonic anhydrase